MGVVGLIKEEYIMEVVMWQVVLQNPHVTVTPTQFFYAMWLLRGGQSDYWGKPERAPGPYSGYSLCHIIMKSTKVLNPRRCIIRVHDKYACAYTYVDTHAVQIQ